MVRKCDSIICEAMACGLPVLCSDVCDNAMYVVEGENGFRFNPHDKDSVVSSFEKLFNLTDGEYDGLCRQSRIKAEQNLSKNTFVESYIKLIEQ